MRVLGFARRVGLGVFAAAILSAPALAYRTPGDRPEAALEHRHPALDVAPRLEGVAAAERPELERALAALDAPAAGAWVDLRTGRFSSLLPATPLLPGGGNRLSWNGLGRRAPANEAELRAAAAEAYAGWLERHGAALGIDPAEVVTPGRVSVLAPDHIVIVSPRVAGGLPVLGSALVAVVRHGNLVLWGAEGWGDLDAGFDAALDAGAARAVVATHVAPREVGEWKGTTAAWLAAAAGEGIEYRRVWVVRPTLGLPDGRFEALVDARTGELLSFRDLRHWGTATQRRVRGGVFPISNDGQSPGGVPDGVEQAGWPMPFSAVDIPGNATVITDQGGNLPLCVDGSITSALSGTYLRMVDTCGSPATSSTGDLDFGAGPGTDCTVPPGTGPGNTHASRTGYFELNQIVAQGRAELPVNAWLGAQLSANMNLNQTCNAFWDGSSVNFFRSGGGCRNTGEIAGIFDHEWGHGMDDNDANGSIMSVGSEGIADIYAALRTDDSCIGRGFNMASGCGGYGNPCIDPPGDAPLCTGVRDVDWANRQDNTPWTPTTPEVLACGGESHCVGYINAETVWDLWNRDLTAAPLNLSRDLARIVATQLTFRGSGSVNNWWVGTGPSAGCNADSGYLQYLAADDDNGNLSDGTPHMSAIFAAFNRHGVSCTTPAVTNSGCAGAPTAAPAVTGTSRDRGADLAWGAVGGASSYRVYRTDGVHQCSFGKILVGETAGTSFADRGLQNGRTYYYQVVPMGADDVCFGGAASACVPVAPSEVGGGEPTLNVIDTLGQLTILGGTGDGDFFLDNCETARVGAALANTGTTTLTNVRVVAASSPSHPGTTILTPLPAPVAASFATCDDVVATLDVQPQGLVAGETFTLEMSITADELTAPVTAEVSFGFLEGDFEFAASRQFTYEGGSEGWQTTAGNFNRSNAAPGGAGGAGTFYYRSSSFLDDQCDVVRSPLVRLTATSTMTLFNRWRIEDASGGQWWDRANIGVVDAATGARTLVTPSGGRAYNASGIGGVCGTEGQPGWAGGNTAPTFDTWATSSWSSAALQTGTLAGVPGYLEVRYGTDPAVNNYGFRFDDLTLTDAEVETADTQSDVCGASNLIFIGDFETGDTSQWSSVVP